MLANKATLCFCLIAITAPAAAEFELSIRAGVLATDNISLATEPNEQNETVLQLNPRLRYAVDSQRVDAILVYEAELNDYQDLDTTEVYHRFEGNLDVEIVDDFFFIQAEALRTQAVLDPDVAIPPSTLPITNNLIDLEEVAVAPRIERRFGSSVSLFSEFEYEEVSYDGQDIQGNSNKNLVFSLGRDQRGTGVTWELRYLGQETSYDETVSFEYQEAEVELGYWASPSTRIFAAYGEESPYDDFEDSSLQEEVWEAGFEYASNRLNAEFAYGERSFGSSWRGLVDLDFERGEFSLSYVQDPSTTGREFLRGTLINPTNPGEFLTRPGFAERYILKRLESNLTLSFRRTDITLTVFDEERGDRTTLSGDPLTDETQTGGVFVVTYQVGSRTELVATAALANILDDTRLDDERQLTQASIELRFQMARRSELSLLLSHASDESTETFGDDYTANVLGLFYTITF